MHTQRQQRQLRGSKARWRRDYEQFRRRLVEAREAAGLTQRDVAAQLGRSQAYVGKSETGERRVDIVELAQFARVYRKPLKYFAPFLGSTRR
jgi:transcriptional regulator with XRE-family HTH domain